MNYRNVARFSRTLVAVVALGCSDDYNFTEPVVNLEVSPQFTSIDEGTTTQLEATFALFEVWPRRLPAWLERWALQVVAVAVSMPVTTVLFYVLSTPQGAPPFWQVPGRMDGWTHLTFAGLLLAPWTALAAIIRQKEASAREQTLSFALERRHSCHGRRRRAHDT